MCRASEQRPRSALTLAPAGEEPEPESEPSGFPRSRCAPPGSSLPYTAVAAARPPAVAVVLAAPGLRQHRIYSASPSPQPPFPNITLALSCDRLAGALAGGWTLSEVEEL